MFQWQKSSIITSLPHSCSLNSKTLNSITIRSSLQIQHSVHQFIILELLSSTEPSLLMAINVLIDSFFLSLLLNAKIAHNFVPSANQILLANFSVSLVIRISYQLLINFHVHVHFPQLTESAKISVRSGSRLAPMHSLLPLEFNVSSVTPIISKSPPTINAFANLGTVTLTTMEFALKHAAMEL
jgi:hypothetical protein